MENPVLIKVLVIGDDRGLSDLLRLVLEPNTYRVLEAHTSSEGIKLARQSNPEVVILDMFVPDLEGWQVCRTLRSFSRVPILVLSAMSKPGMLDIALGEGADEYLLKPIPSSVLAAHVKRLARREMAEKTVDQSADKTLRDYYLPST